MKSYIVTIKLIPDIWHLDSNIEFVDIPLFHIKIKADSEKEAREAAKKITFNFDIVSVEEK